MRDAVECLRRLAPRQSGDNPLDDPAFHANSYSIETHDPTKELRIAFYRDKGQTGLLGYMVLESPEVYDLSKHLTKHYDRLEGIE
jgi:hypothetical protein